MGVRFALLAEGATFDVLADKLSETRPPIFGSNELAGFEIARMARRGVVVRASDNVAAERCRIWDIDAVLVGEETTIDLPVGKTRAEGRGNGAVESLEGIANKNIIARMGEDEIAQGGIHHADKERGG